MTSDRGFKNSEEANRSFAPARSQTDFGDRGPEFGEEGKTSNPARSLDGRAGAMVTIALALPVATFVLARCWSVPLYLSNDDVGMELLLRGAGVTSRPTAFVQFMHVGLGEVLVWLYAHVSGLSWYQVLMNGVLVLAGLTVSWAAMRRGLNWNRLVLIAVYCLGFLLTFFVQPNFSISAAMATQAAMILWLGEIAKGRALAGTRLWAFIGLVLIGGMIRIDACMLQAAVAVPVALWLAFGLGQSAPLTLPSLPEAGAEGIAEPEGLARYRSSLQFSVFRFQWVRAVVLPLFIIGAISGLLRVSQSYVYSSTPGWEHFEEFNKLRAQFTDYQAVPFSDESRAVYERAGWSENDYDMLMSWFFENPQLYNIAKFKAILSQAPHATEEGGKQLSRLLLQVQNDPGMRLMVVGACISLLFARGRGGLTAIAIVAATLVVAMIVLVIVLHRLPPWFSGPLLAFVPAVAMVLPSSAPPGDRSLTALGRRAGMLRYIYLALQLLAVGLFGWALFDALKEWHRESTMISQARTTFIANLTELASRWHGRETVPRQMTAPQHGSGFSNQRPDRIYVAWGGVFPYELILDNEDFRTISKLRIIALGCLSQTPINNERLRDLGIEDLYRAIFKDPRVQVICHPDYGAHFMRYVHEHYGKHIQGRVLEAKPLGEYPIFNPIEGRYDVLNRLLWLQDFREKR